MSETSAGAERGPVASVAGRVDSSACIPEYTYFPGASVCLCLEKTFPSLGSKGMTASVV
jgi:hypothetical protein